MNTLVNVEYLLGRLTEKIKSLLVERRIMKSEITYLRARIKELDNEYVSCVHDLHSELELLNVDISLLERERMKADSSIDDTNKRLIELARVAKHHRG